MDNPVKTLSLFAGYGIELEYMIVHRDDLDVLSISDRILKEVAGEYVNEVKRGAIAWSNEVVLHVIELKSNGPAANLYELPQLFLDSIRNINEILAGMDGMLMPTAMHPWMNPYLETRLWPHDETEIYDSYNRIFNCRGHGWSNLQSMHINLPFADDTEFAQLHSAIRLLLPVLPAIAASSPVMEGELTGLMDTRLETYRRNAELIPSIAGLVVPEPMTSRQEYETTLLQPMYADIAPHDPEKILQEEWLNSRGAIARFERNTIEIRVLDTQESPVADLAIASLVVAVLKKLSTGDWIPLPNQLKLPTEVLAGIFTDIIRNSEKTIIDNRDYLAAFNFPDHRCEAQELWQYLFEAAPIEAPGDNPEQVEALRFILKHGPLARRIARPLKQGYRRPKLKEVYRVLCTCLDKGEMFEGID